jgi:hypothetical protein
MKFIRIPYSAEQLTAQTDSQLYGLAYGIQPGELGYVITEMAKRGHTNVRAWSHTMDEINAEHVIMLRERDPIRCVTVWNKKGDHPKVWEDYISTCGGDTDNGHFYITSGNRQIEVFPGDSIYDMADGTYQVKRPT